MKGEITNSPLPPKYTPLQENLEYHVEEQFKGLFADIFNILELSVEEPKCEKIKNLIGHRLADSRDKLEIVISNMVNWDSFKNR